MKTEFDFLAGGGEMGKVLRAMDWSRTSLGPIEGWPQSLRTTVSLCLASNFPISIAWGPERTQIYNDGYWPICGAKHPHSMGQDFRQCWQSAWPVIGAAFDQASAGHSAFLENQRIFIDRNGYLEETFFTFSFSPIRDESGGVGGLFHPVTELTQRTLAERRLKVLHDLADGAAEGKSAEGACVLVARTLADHDRDLPFVLLYLVDGKGEEAHLASVCGLEAEGAWRPASIALREAPPGTWPLEHAVRSSGMVQVDDLAAKFGELACGPYPEPPSTAIVMPISAPGLEHPLAFVVAGVSSRRAFDDRYRSFYVMLQAAVTSSLVNARAYEQERKRAEALVEIDRAKTAFFSNVSHEFRTPLTLMLGPVEDILADVEQPLPAAQRERLELVHRSGLRLKKLVNTLLDFSRIEAGRAHASYAPTQLAALTADLVSSFRSAIEKAGLVLSADCPPLEEPAYVDRDMWEKIVLNLLSNAFKSTFEGEITVRLRQAGGFFNLEVRDTGIGIAADELPRLFERFRRIDGARSRTHEGTGIGLALVQELVKLHGGTVRVESEAGTGSTFTVAIPAGKAHLPADRIGAEGTLASTALGAGPYLQEALRWLPDAEGVSPPPAAGPRERIVWAEDNADMRDYVRRLLANRYEVESVVDGEAALAAVRRKRPALVLADVMMPKLDGLGLVRALRADAQTRPVPVVLLSARAGEESRIEGLGSGADDYLQKPFSARELLARIAARLELGRLNAQLDDERREASRHKDEFMAMLAHELRNPLSAIGLSSEILERLELQDHKARFAVAAIGRQRKQMQRLVDDLLDVARVTFGKLGLNREPVDLLGAACDVAADFVRSTKGAEVVADGTSQWIDGDPVRVRQMISNLVDNAVKYGGKNVRIRVGADEDRAQVTVEDDGQGIAPETLPTLFMPFAQGKQALDRAPGGLGLGLALVDRLAALHGGELEAKSAGPGMGAAFTISFPGASAPNPAASPSPAAAVSRRRVLVVEDQEDARETLRMLLEMHGHEVSTAVDGVEGLAKLGALLPHIALVDIGLPGLDGYEVARRARVLPGRARITLVAVTGYGLDHDRQQATDAGFDLHLTKPVDYEQLKQAFGMEN